MCRMAFGCVQLGAVVCLTGVLAAQEPPRQLRILVGPLSGVYATSHRDGPAMGFGVAVGLERSISQRISVRGLAIGIKTDFTNIGVRVCQPSPLGCRPPAVFPKGLVSGEFQSVASPLNGVPARVLGGVGVVIPIGGRANEVTGTYSDSSTGVRLTFRTGLEVSFGKSRRAPRAQLTRTGFSKAIFSMNWLDALGILFPF